MPGMWHADAEGNFAVYGVRTTTGAEILNGVAMLFTRYRSRNDQKKKPRFLGAIFANHNLRFNDSITFAV
jgi:hypothetical protein